MLRVLHLKQKPFRCDERKINQVSHIACAQRIFWTDEPQSTTLHSLYVHTSMFLFFERAQCSTGETENSNKISHISKKV
jgi:hypothetical protein